VAGVGASRSGASALEQPDSGEKWCQSGLIDE
jgi:hypothetical protein